MVKYPSQIRSAIRQINRGYAMKSRQAFPYRKKRGDSFLLVLKRNGTDKNWDVLARIENYDRDTSRFRNKTYFQVATLENTYGLDNNKSFGEIVGIATHIAILPQNEFYNLKDGDENNIISTDFVYTLFATSVGDKFTGQELGNIYEENDPPTLPVLSFSEGQFSWTESIDDFSPSEEIQYTIEIDIV